MTETVVGRKKRTKYEIIHDILSQCENGAKKTWLIAQRDGLYYLTEKGKKLLELLKEYKEKKTALDKVTAQIKEIYGED